MYVFVVCYFLARLTTGRLSYKARFFYHWGVSRYEECNKKRSTVVNCYLIFCRLSVNNNCCAVYIYCVYFVGGHVNSTNMSVPGDQPCDNACRHTARRVWAVNRCVKQWAVNKKLLLGISLISHSTMVTGLSHRVYLAHRNIPLY